MYTRYSSYRKTSTVHESRLRQVWSVSANSKFFSLFMTRVHKMLLKFLRSKSSRNKTTNDEKSTNQMANYFSSPRSRSIFTLAESLHWLYVSRVLCHSSSDTIFWCIFNDKRPRVPSLGNQNTVLSNNSIFISPELNKKSFSRRYLWKRAMHLSFIGPAVVTSALHVTFVMYTFRATNQGRGGHLIRKRAFVTLAVGDPS